MASSKRDQLLDMAVELFFKKGCHTTGIDQLLAKAGVAKMTLYAHFKSKEELILAAAERLHECQMEQIRGIVGEPGKSPLDCLHAIYDQLEATLASPDYVGCPFQNISVEFSDPEHPIHQMAARHVAEIEVFFRDALTTAGADQPLALARQLMALCEGAKTLVRMTGDRDYVTQARAAADRLLALAIQ